MWKCVPISELYNYLKLVIANNVRSEEEKMQTYSFSTSVSLLFNYTLVVSGHINTVKEHLHYRVRLGKSFC